MEKLDKLLEYGQSYWLDNLSREMIENGELKKRITEEGLRGITSNPKIFSEAMSKGNRYDDQIRALSEKEKEVDRIYESLAIKDIQNACDMLREVYDSSGGVDGFVSLEVSPYLAKDTEKSKEDARRLFKAVDRPNCFIKIPGTKEGIPAIEEMLYEGININITLLFAISSYEAVAEAYIRALERRLDEGRSVSRLSSVASFFLSRIDVLVDKRLHEEIIPGLEGDKKLRAENLLGQSAIASAKIAYESFERIFSGKRWENLVSKGARVQRPLWASTSTKTEGYRDTRYVEPLIGPYTVNTMPEKTIEAFKDHGILEPGTIRKDLDKAHRVFDDLDEVGIRMKDVTDKLVDEGISKFVDPYDELLDSIKEKATHVASWKGERTR